jgi:hypothetical protein
MNHVRLCCGTSFDRSYLKEGLQRPGSDADASRLGMFTRFAHAVGCPMGLIHLCSSQSGSCKCSVDAEGRPIPEGETAAQDLSAVGQLILLCTCIS